MPVKYAVHNVTLKEAEFEVLILEIPKDELEDKLAYLAREKGQITRSFYEDFVIATTVANINQLLYHVSQTVSSPPDLMKVREELVESIYKVNPSLKPDRLVINRNYVVKIKAEDEKLSEDEKKLTENKNWDTSYYDDITNAHKQKDNKQKPPNEDKKIKKPKGDSNKQREIKDINCLDFEIVQKWWKRIGQYVSIKKFKEEDIESILSQKYFHNRVSFGTFIVSICIAEFEELFQLLDNLGIPARVAPPILMNELYQLCKSVNEHLTFENAQKIAENEMEDDGEEENPIVTPGVVGRRNSKQSTMSQYLKKKPKRKFKDVSKEELLNLGNSMKVLLIGQDEAVDTLADSIQRASVGLKDPNRPIGSFLFAGRTGVGKTLATKILADELIKGRDNMVTIDCSEYSADHEYSKLIGAPSGYIGHEAGGLLTNAVQKNPFSVVVFDEVEKASHKVHELLLQILEEGRLTDGKGRPASFKDAVIIMTSNIGVKEVEDIKKTIGFGDVATITDEKKDAALTQALKKKFKPEFLNRIDAIINFKNLSKNNYMRIIDIELYKLNDNLKNNDTEYKNVVIKFDEKVRKFIYEKGIDEEYGARPLKRAIEKNISTPLAKKLLGVLDTVDVSVDITVNKGKVVFKISKKVEDPPFYISEEYNNMMEAGTSLPEN